MSTALIVVDIQNDFCEGGALAVEGGNKVAEDVADYIGNNGTKYDKIVFTRDWHQAPPSDNGGHFALPPAEPDFIDTWPVHCVQGTKGAEFHPAIASTAEFFGPESVFLKGDGKPDYSGFQGFSATAKLDDYLTSRGITAVDVVGLAGDYCVRQTALDAIAKKYSTMVLPELTASVRGDKGLAETFNLMTDALG